MLKVGMLLSALVGFSAFAGSLHDRLPPVTRPIHKEIQCPPGTHAVQVSVAGNSYTMCVGDIKYPTKPPGF